MIILDSNPHPTAIDTEHIYSEVMTQAEWDEWADREAARLREEAENFEGMESSNGAGVNW